MNFEKGKNKKCELHILMPSTNGVINCDDKGMLKTFTDINGKKHQRISSQCQNRATRETMADNGFNIGYRMSGVEFYEHLVCELQMLNMSQKDIDELLKKEKNKENSLYESYSNAKNVGFHISKNEMKYFAEAIVKNGNKYNKDFVNKYLEQYLKSIDVILHGRMNAKNVQDDVHGAMYTSDAIAINPLIIDEDYRTLVSDDKNRRQGAINIDTVQQSSSLFYKHCIIDYNTLIKNADYDENYIKELLSWNVLKYYAGILGNGKSHAKHTLMEPCYIAMVISNMGYAIPTDIIINKSQDDAIDSIHNYLIHRKSSPMEIDDNIKFAEYSMNGIYNDDVKYFFEKEFFN